MGLVQIFCRVTILVMLFLVLLGLLNLWLIAIKDIVLLVIVGFSELMLEMWQVVGLMWVYFTFFLVAGVLYLVMMLLLGCIFGWIEVCYWCGQAAQ